MKKEDSRVGKRDVPTTPSAKICTDKFARTSASANVQPSDSTPPAALIPLMMSTKLSLSSASPSREPTVLYSPETAFPDSPTHSSSSCTTADTPGTTRTFGTKLTVDVVSSIANSPSAELDTPSVKRAANLLSEPAIQIRCKTWLMG